MQLHTCTHNTSAHLCAHLFLHCASNTKDQGKNDLGVAYKVFWMHIKVDFCDLPSALFQDFPTILGLGDFAFPSFLRQNGAVTGLQLLPSQD